MENKNIVFANEGDKVKCTNGEIYEFIRLKRTKFIGKNEKGTYDIPIQMFVEIVEKAGPKKINQSYKRLKEGDLFYIKKGDDAIVYSYIEMSNGRIIGKNPVHGGRTRIDIGLYGGKITELKKQISA